MTIISSNIDNGPSFDGYRTTSSNQVIVVLSGVVIDGATGIASGITDTNDFYRGEDIYNNGYIFGTKGIDLYGAASVFNGATGVISANQGISLNGDGGHISNAGTIDARQRGLYLEGDRLAVKNTGTISADATSILALFTSNLTVRNTGSIVGDVEFGSGANLYNGRGGTLNGTIFGGSGVDTVYLGNDGETVQGGDGHDVLYGGAGADTFVFTSSAAGTSDAIHHFSAAQDTLEFTHAGFGTLAVGQAPVFAVGTKAASADDHLFYNSTTGGLYYDQDGSGTKQAARLVATLDTGLKLTANNFEVV